MSVNKLAQALVVPANRLNEIVDGAGVSPPTPLCVWPVTSAHPRSFG
jgi:hypothetical protein